MPQTKTDSVKEFDFTGKDFERVRAMIYKRAGIALADSKPGDGLQPPGPGACARPASPRSSAIWTTWKRAAWATKWEAFTNALTTNLTSFFREAHHFPLLAEHVKKLSGPITIWCSASSTGEEPYSIAMTVCEAFNTLTPPVTIITLDIDTNVLATAANGVYNLDRLDKMPADRARRFFLRGKGDREGQVRVRPELRQMITFKPLNLLADGWPLTGQFDVIFCRNVMIYFDKATQRKILSRFVPLMKPDALLFAGHSENFLYVSDSLKLRGKTVYELDQPQAPAPKAPSHRT